MGARTSVAQPLAAIDLGTNTVRLLVALPRVVGDAVDLTVLANRTATVRLGFGVERTGRLDPERMARAVATVEEFRRLAVEHNAAPIFVAATSAVRDAANGPEFCAQVLAQTGLSVEIVTGDREAALTFAGATAGQSLAGTLLVGDLGGGSLELIVSQQGTIQSAVSLQLGSGRLTERHIQADPPDRAAIAAAEADALALLAPLAANSPQVDRLIVVGGTAAAITVLVPRTQGADRLTSRRLEGAIALLTAAPAATLASETGLDPERVRTMPAGVAIVRAMLAAYGLDTAQVGSGGIREGLLIDYVRTHRPEFDADSNGSTSSGHHSR